MRVKCEIPDLNLIIKIHFDSDESAANRFTEIDSKLNPITHFVKNNRIVGIDEITIVTNQGALFPALSHVGLFR